MPYVFGSVFRSPFCFTNVCFPPQCQNSFKLCSLPGFYQAKTCLSFTRKSKPYIRPENTGTWSPSEQGSMGEGLCTWHRGHWATGAKVTELGCSVDSHGEEMLCIYIKLQGRQAVYYRADILGQSLLSFRKVM